MNKNKCIICNNISMKYKKYCYIHKNRHFVFPNTYFKYNYKNSTYKYNRKFFNGCYDEDCIYCNNILN